MNVRITPAKLRGEVTVPPSKSVAHRMIIGAALAEGTSKITNLYPSVDITATMDCMRALGAKIDFKGDTAVVVGIDKIPEKAELNCCESGSTLRFLIPVACALGVECTFKGEGKLPKRPIKPLVDELPKHGIEFDFSRAADGEILPCKVKGRLTGGKFFIDGGISSQFITGLLFALPLLEEDSEIVLTSRLESRPYVDITIGVLKDFGCDIRQTQTGYFVKGGQKLSSFNGEVEGDYSQAAFFYTANCLGADIDIKGLNEGSRQGDKKIVEICGSVRNGSLDGFELDCSDIPDLVPILAVLASFCKGKSRLTDVARLRIKECDRLAAMEECINRLGGKVTAGEDVLEIRGVEAFGGGEVSSFNDHRIVMAMAIAAAKCQRPIIINGAEAVRKSYPNFFEVYRSLGGKFEVI